MIRKTIYILLPMLSAILIVTSAASLTNHRDMKQDLQNDTKHNTIEQDIQKHNVQKLDLQEHNVQKQDAQERDIQKQDAQERDIQKQDAQEHDSSISMENSNKSTVNKSGTAAVEQKAGQSSVPVLMYHSINNVPLGLEQLSVRKQDFERQIKYLSDNGYTPLFFDELKNSGNYSKPIIISFDDGYNDNYFNAYPILKKYRFKATVFVIAKRVNTNNFLTKDQITEMADLVSFQSHTFSHPELDKIGKDQLENEFTLSKEILGGITNKPVNTLAYPHGKYNTRVAQIASRYFDYAVTTRPGHYSKADGNYEMKRVRISRSDTLQYFIAKIR